MQKKLTKEFVNQKRELLKSEAEKINRQVEELKARDPFADPDHASDNAAVDTDVREQVGHDTIEAQIKDLEKRLASIGHALKRAEKGMYGLCEKCNKEIAIARLDLVPEASYCIDCEKLLRQ